ncbi:uncharacterized protein TNCV_1798791 [Trichonephila clavipes]|uniref:Uncharacterized protein n=1 Tax=Trichonephila clavipes TaxID=2585209 RepID=A0A8X6VBR2_TRICX|nr:uncharacterized protein TNCV_1798791 [Trichonephila clavipes]
MSVSSSSPLTPTTDELRQLDRSSKLQDLLPIVFVLLRNDRHHSKRRRRWVGVKGSTRNGRHDPKCPSARRLRMFREDTGTPNEGANCTWMAANEAVGCTGAFLTMGWSSRLVCLGRSETGLCVTEISWIHWSQHLLTTQSERSN